MSDQHEQDIRDQDEVEIEDLGAPDRGLSRYFFTLGEKWRTVASLSARLVMPVVTLCLLIAVLLPGSSGMNTRTPSAVPAHPLPPTIYLIDCGITINVSSLPAHVVVWEQVISTPAAQECSFFSHPGSQCPMPQQLLPTTSTGQEVGIGCNAGTPLPVSAGKGGKNR